MNVIELKALQLIENFLEMYDPRFNGLRNYFNVYFVKVYENS